MVSSASPSPAQPSFSVNWFALRLYTFMVLVVAVAARHRRRSYRNDETAHGPGHHSLPALAAATHPGAPALPPHIRPPPGRGNTATLTALRRRRY